MGQDDDSDAWRQTAAAKLVCYRCLVAADCLAWALRTGLAEGVWGVGTRRPSAASCTAGSH